MRLGNYFISIKDVVYYSVEEILSTGCKANRKVCIGFRNGYVIETRASEDEVARLNSCWLT